MQLHVKWIFKHHNIKYIAKVLSFQPSNHYYQVPYHSVVVSDVFQDDDNSPYGFAQQILILDNDFDIIEFYWK